MQRLCVGVGGSRRVSLCGLIKKTGPRSVFCFVIISSFWCIVFGLLGRRAVSWALGGSTPRSFERMFECSVTVVSGAKRNFHCFLYASTAPHFSSRGKMRPKAFSSFPPDAPVVFDTSFETCAGATR